MGYYPEAIPARGPTPGDPYVKSALLVVGLVAIAVVAFTLSPGPASPDEGPTHDASNPSAAGSAQAADPSAGSMNPTNTGDHGGSVGSDASVGSTGSAASVALGQLACTPTGSVAERVSPYDSATVRTSGGDGGEIKVCYSRPSARGRTMIGGEYHPFGELWRTGANEPTILHLSIPAEIAGIALDPGSFSLYTIPEENEWEIFLNASTSHWGNQLTEEVRAQEIGSATVPAQVLDEHVETFTLRFEPPSERTTRLILEWEHILLSIPVRFLDS